MYPFSDWNTTTSHDETLRQEEQVVSSFSSVAVMLRHSAERGARTVRAEEQSSGTALSRTLRTAEPSVVAVPYVCEVRSHFFFRVCLPVYSRERRQEL